MWINKQLHDFVQNAVCLACNVFLFVSVLGVFQYVHMLNNSIFTGYRAQFYTSYPQATATCLACNLQVHKEIHKFSNLNLMIS